MDGHLEEAMELSQSIQVRGEEAGIREYARTQGLAILRPRLHLGKADEVLQLVPESSPWLVALCLANLGRDTEAAEILEQRVLARPGIGSAEDEVSAGIDIMFLEAAVLVRHREVADLLLKRLAGWGIATTGGGTTCVARHLGAAAALLDRPEEALTYYQEAIKVCTEMRFRPDMALTRLQLAELLLEHYPDEKPEALEHLDFAISEFRDMKMQPSLERALKHKEILGA